MYHIIKCINASKMRHMRFLADILSRKCSGKVPKFNSLRYKTHVYPETESYHMELLQ